MELLEKLTPIIIAFLGGLFGQPVIQLISSFHRRKLKKITNANEAHQLFDKYGSDFKTEFILPDLKETYFYVQTGIKTNEKSIKKYIKFKNNLGKNYTWNHIKLVKPHLDFEGDEIKIKLRKLERVISDVALIVALVLFLTGFFGFMYLNQIKTQNVKDIFFLAFVLIIPIVFGYLLMNGVNSIIVAKGMEKQLTVPNNNNYI